MDITEKTIWCAHTLFSKGLASGSTGNISYRENDTVFISQSGSCFGLLDKNSFAQISLDGKILCGKPSKEWLMHLKLYQKNASTKAVIHTHSFHSTLISCVKNIEEHISDLLSYTPYLKMQTNGNIGIVEYGEPGTDELFGRFNDQVNERTNVYLLKNHGVFVAAADPLKAFYLLEEFETSSRMVLEIKNNQEFSKIR